MIVAPLYYLMVKAVGRVLGGIPFVTLACNLLLLATAVLVAIGDPIVFAINKRFPELLDVADFKFFNLVTAIIVHR